MAFQLIPSSFLRIFPYMNLSVQERKTAKTYDMVAVEWTQKHMKYVFWKEELEYFYQLLPQGKVLEIGSGSGRDAKELKKYGYDYIGIDISQGLLQEARKNIPEAAFLHYSIYDLHCFRTYFDGFWSVATLLHIPKARIDEALQNIYSSMKPHAIGLISLKEGDGEQFEKEGNAQRFFAYYKEEEFAEILKKNKFKIIKADKKRADSCTWLIYFVEVLK
jgi:SAM-dependent methyltransferase